MGSNQSNQAQVSNFIGTTVNQDVNIKCNATCTNISSGNTTTIIGGTFGSITFSQKCTADAACVISNAQEIAVDNLVENIVKQTATSSGLAGAIFNNNSNIADIRTQVNNYLNQQTQIECNANSTNISTGNVIYLQDVTAGSFAVSQEGDATANCIIENLAKATVSNTIKNKIDQTAKNTGLDFAGIIIAIIVGVIFVIGLALFFLLKGKTPPNPNTVGTTGASSTTSSTTKTTTSSTSSKPPTRPPPLPPKPATSSTTTK